MGGGKEHEEEGREKLEMTEREMWDERKAGGPVSPAQQSRPPPPVREPLLPEAAALPSNA